MGNQLFMDASIKNIEVKSKDVVFIVYRTDSKTGEDYKHGELRLSQGGVVWRGHGDKDGRKLGWVSFDKVMQDKGYRRERRKPGTSRTVRKKYRK
jgi:hypothetical protein